VELTQDEFNNWKNHPVTQEVFAILKQRKRHETESLAYGHTLDTTSSVAAIISTSKAVGIIEGIDMMLEKNFFKGGER
jgi:hypothetical protein